MSAVPNSNPEENREPKEDLQSKQENGEDLHQSTGITRSPLERFEHLTIEVHRDEEGYLNAQTPQGEIFEDKTPYPFNRNHIQVTSSRPKNRLKVVTADAPPIELSDGKVFEIDKILAEFTNSKQEEPPSHLSIKYSGPAGQRIWLSDRIENEGFFSIGPMGIDRNRFKLQAAKLEVEPIAQALTAINSTIEIEELITDVPFDIYEEVGSISSTPKKQDDSYYYWISDGEIEYDAIELDGKEEVARTRRPAVEMRTGCIKNATYAIECQITPQSKGFSTNAYMLRPDRIVSRICVSPEADLGEVADKIMEAAYGPYAERGLIDAFHDLENAQRYIQKHFTIESDEQQGDRLYILPRKLKNYLKNPYQFFTIEEFYDSKISWMHQLHDEKYLLRYRPVAANLERCEARRELSFAYSLSPCDGIIQEPEVVDILHREHGPALFEGLLGPIQNQYLAALRDPELAVEYITQHYTVEAVDTTAADDYAGIPRIFFRKKDSGAEKNALELVEMGWGNPALESHIHSDIRALVEHSPKGPRPEEWKTCDLSALRYALAENAHQTHLTVGSYPRYGDIHLDSSQNWVGKKYRSPLDPPEDIHLGKKEEFVVIDTTHEDFANACLSLGDQRHRGLFEYSFEAQKREEAHVIGLHRRDETAKLLGTVLKDGDPAYPSSNKLLVPITPGESRQLVLRINGEHRKGFNYEELATALFQHTDVGTPFVVGVTITLSKQGEITYAPYDNQKVYYGDSTRGMKHYAFVRKK